MERGDVSNNSSFFYCNIKVIIIADLFLYLMRIEDIKLCSEGSKNLGGEDGVYQEQRMYRID